MIFVTVGVQLPFDRLIGAMDTWAGQHPDTPVVAQTGATSYVCRHMRAFVKLDGAGFQGFVEAAELIVAHAGMGSILTALELGKPIIILPRSASLNEHRNDHQRATAQFMADSNLVRVAKDVDELTKLVDSRDSIKPRSISNSAQTSLVETIRLFVGGQSTRGILPPPEQLTRPGSGLSEPAIDQVKRSVSVIIPHFNDVNGLKKCLFALACQTYAPHEIIVCDNGSACGVEEVRRICDTLATVIAESEKGAGAARNAAVKQATGDILAFLDSDCVPNRDWIAAGCRALEASHLVGGAVALSFKESSSRTPVEAFEAQFAFPNRRYIEQEQFSVTANMFVPRAIFQVVGEFRKDVPEDKDWGQRAHKMGYRWGFAPDAIVTHPARSNWQELLGKWRRLTREAYAYAPNRGYFLTRSWLVVLSLPLFLVSIAKSKRLHRWQDKLSAAMILVRLRFWRFYESHRLVLSDVKGDH